MKWILLVLGLNIFAGVHAQKKNCCHAPAFSFEDFPEALPLGNIGNCHLKIASSKDSVQFYLDQGLNTYFNFNYYESFMAFRKAYSIDTSCVGCLLGVLIALDHSDDDTEVYLDYLGKVQDLVFQEVDMTDDEGYWYDLEVGTLDGKLKFFDQRYGMTLETWFENDPNNAVVAAFYLRYLDRGMENKNLIHSETLKGDSLIKTFSQEVLENSAIKHLCIHFYEDYIPSKTLPYVEGLVDLAPQSGHLVHMPGHAYYYNGMYDQAIDAFKKGFLVDSSYNQRYKHGKDVNWNLIHNLDFLCLALTEQGRLKEAKSWAKKTQKYTYLWNAGKGGEDNPRIHSTPYKIAYRLQRWQEASLEVEKVLEEDELAFDEKYLMEGKKLFFDGMHAFQQDHNDTLQLFVDKLKKHQKEGKKLYKKNKVKLGAGNTSSFIDMVGIHHDMLKLLSDYKENKDPDMVSKTFRLENNMWIHQQTDPPSIPLLFEELMALLYEKQREYDKAIDQLKLALEARPNSATIYLQLARMYHRTRQKTEAMTHLHQFQEKWINADKDLIEFEKARVLQLDLNK